MSEKLMLKVVCGKCGTKIGKVYDDGGGGFVFAQVSNYSKAFIGTGAFWCAEQAQAHGWTSHEDVVDEVARTIGAATVPTFKATMYPNTRGVL